MAKESMGTQSGGFICIRTQTIRCQACDRETLYENLVKWEGEKIRRGQIEESQSEKGAYLRAREQRL